MRTLSVLAFAVLLAPALPVARDAAHYDPRVADRVADHGGAKAVLVVGRVTEGGGAAVMGASVQASGTAAGGQTGADGRYSFALPDSVRRAGRVTLQVRRIGYQTLTRVVPLTRDTVVANFTLVSATLRLQSEVVMGAVVPSSIRPPMVADMSMRAQKSVLGNGSGAIGAAFGAGTGGGMARDASGRLRHRVPDDSGNTENYATIDDNPFLGVSDHALSTFSADVDRASYGNVRRFILGQGQRPPRDAVRIEELVNYFPYSYPAPKAGEPFSITTEVAAAPWTPAHRLVRIGLQTAKIETAALPPVNLVFLIDVSGSMMSPDKLPLVKEGFRMLVDQLRPQDRVAIVVYAGNAGLVLPSTSGADKERIVQAIDALEAGGSTAGGAGINLAYDVARQNFQKSGMNRVILATDGDFNVGASSNAELVRLIERRRTEGTFLTVLGFGTGNLKDSRMEQLADKGNGHYAYVDGPLEARKVFVTELGGTLVTVAKDVKLQVEFNPATVGAYRLIGYENRLLAAEDFNDDSKDAGEIGAGHAVTALYEVVPRGQEAEVLRSVDGPRYERPTGGSATSVLVPDDAGPELMFVKVRYKDPHGDRSLLLSHAVPGRATDRPSDDFTFAAAVAEFGMSLRESPYRGAATLESAAALARRSLGSDAGGYRAEFLRMVEAAGGREMAKRE